MVAHFVLVVVALGKCFAIAFFCRKKEKMSYFWRITAHKTVINLVLNCCLASVGSPSGHLLVKFRIIIITTPVGLLLSL